MRTSIQWRGMTRMLGALLAAAAGMPALAQQTPAQNMISSPLVGSLGAFILNTDLKARLDGSSTTNPDVNFNDSFGRARDATRIRADALWRITPAHHLRFMYFDYSSSNTRQLANDVTWGDYTFLAGSNATSEFKLNTAALAYEWAFLRNPNYEVAASFGLHYMQTKISISGRANVRDANGNVTVVNSATREGDAPMPLPLFGIRGGWAVAPNWYLEAQGQLFRVEIDEYKGNVSDLTAKATYMFTKNFGAGIGYNHFFTRVDVDRSNFHGKLRLGYQGAMLYVAGAF